MNREFDYYRVKNNNNIKLLILILILIIDHVVMRKLTVYLPSTYPEENYKTQVSLQSSSFVININLMMNVLVKSKLIAPYQPLPLVGILVLVGFRN